MPGQPLSGIRVVECVGWNGVYAGRLLAEGGADVLRIVPPGGDPLASEPPFLPAGPSIQELWYNAGKRVMALDLTTDAGRDHLLGLLAGADIVVEDWTPGDEPLSASRLAAACPRLVRVSVTPVGREALRPLLTNDLVANALSGSASVTGSTNTPPLSGYGNQTYHTVGLYAAICALAALRVARASGQPQHVDLSAHEALVSCTEQVLMEWFFRGNWSGRLAPRQGSLHWSGAYEVYPGRTGQGIMVTAALRLEEAVLPWMAGDGLAGDLVDREKFPNLVSMVQNLPYVMSVMRNWVATHDAEEMFYEAQARHLPFGVVWSVAEALAKSPQIAARGYVQGMALPAGGRTAVPGNLMVTDADGPRLGAASRCSVGDVAWEPRAPAAGGSSGAHSALPLAGVRVLDFTHVLAGPFGTRVLADLGADVIKVGTAARASGANNPNHPYYVSWNRNKRSIALDLASETGRQIARQLAARCDVLIENFSAGVISRWGLDRRALAAVNPGLTVVSMGGMGQTGPWKHFVTFAPTVHALTGLTYLTNPPGEHLLGYGFSLTDHLSGLAGALAALEGLAHRDRTGEGLEVDLSQYELGLHIMAPALIDHLANGIDPEPVGNRHPFAAWAPHGVYPASGEDRWVAIAVRDDAGWHRLCQLMGRPELAADPRFATHAERVANADALDAAVAAWTSTRDRYEVMAACQAAGVAAGAVQDAADLTERDENLAAAEFFGQATATNERWGEYGLDRFPARFNGERPPRYEGSHDLGTDTFAVLTELLDLDDEAIAGLVAAGVLA